MNLLRSNRWTNYSISESVTVLDTGSIRPSASGLVRDASGLVRDDATTEHYKELAEKVRDFSVRTSQFFRYVR
jgi:hypothetical protein